MTNHPETPAIEALDHRQNAHKQALAKLSHPYDTITNLMTNGMPMKPSPMSLGLGAG